MDIIDDLLDIANELEREAERKEEEGINESLDNLEEAISQADDAFSNSWIGYHSRVYYKDLKPPPQEAHFSKESGLRGFGIGRSTKGDWVEYSFGDVVKAILQAADDPPMQELESAAESAEKIFEEKQFQTLSLISEIGDRRQDDDVLRELKNNIKGMEVHGKQSFIDSIRPSGSMMTRDQEAIADGQVVPPHMDLLAESLRIKHSFGKCEELAKEVRRLASHLDNLSEPSNFPAQEGTHVFIGHGRSLVWKDLKDFIQDRLGLQWDEFNRVPVAGKSNKERLSEMMDDAAIAFLILTAEDEHQDGTRHARENVLHEAGLFQGRLGFERAIILLEEECEEFSNIHGLGQIRFPEGDISAAFEEIRRVLEREGIISD